MKTIGIIAEFNPFHNGHKYLIDEAKRITNAENVVIICSGNYVQRGTPAIIDKSIRAETALNNGADAVFELPVFYSTASAELFARASVNFLTQLNCIDFLCFGCENDDLEELSAVASVLCDEPDIYKNILSKYLKTGISFPKARINAIRDYCEANNLSCDIDKLLSSPNNILAIEYIKAIKFFNSKIKPVPIKRLGAGYNSNDINEAFASATGIRTELTINGTKNIKQFVPEDCYTTLSNINPVNFDDFCSILGYKLISENDFDKYYGINNELSNRINNYKNQFNDIDTFIDALHSKNYTYSGISRALLHVILNIKKSDVEAFIDSGYFSWARLLGFNKNSNILSLIKEKSTLDIISKLSAYYNECSAISKKMLDVSIKADELYRMIYMNKYKKIIPTEFERQIVVK